MKDDFFGFSAKMGAKINGLIGYDIFNSFIVEIDYIHERLILHNPVKYKHKERKQAVVKPFIIQNKKSYLTTEITQEDGSIIPVKLLIDTGSSLALWLSLNSNKDIKLPSKYNDTY
ncbi:aspartate aminotransferase, partial [Bacteroidota bacterium]